MFCEIINCYHSRWMAALSTTPADVAGLLTRAFYADSEDIEFGNPWWFVYASISCFLVLFAGIMSGLTLGLMSLGLVELEILQRSGTSTEKKQAGILQLFCFSLFSFDSGNQLWACGPFFCTCSWRELNLFCV